MGAVTVVLKPFQRRIVTLFTTCFVNLLNSKKKKIQKKGPRVSKSTRTEYIPSTNKFEQQNLINCFVICYSIQKNIMLSASPASLRVLYVGKLPMCISGQVCYIVILQHIYSIGTQSRRVDQAWSILYCWDNNDCGCHRNNFSRFCICIKRTNKNQKQVHFCLSEYLLL